MLSQKNRKNIGISMIVLGLLLIALIVYFIIMQPNNNNVNIVEPVENEIEIAKQIEGTTTPSNIPRNYQEYDISQEDEHIFNSMDLGKLADSFAERFGSFTNQSQYENFTDLEMFMTESFSDWTKNYVKKLEEESPDNKYFYGISTTALYHELVKFDDEDGVGVVIVNTERKETDMTGSSDSYRQELELNFVKVGDEWLVDSAYWEK